MHEPLTTNRRVTRIAFIGSAGIPNRYGGFEGFLEHCAPWIARQVPVTVTCDAHLYPGSESDFDGVERQFIRVRANGAQSILHDLIAFLRVFRASSHIVVLGVSAGPWVPLFRLFCDLAGKRLMVNIDGVEWRRDKFGPWRKRLLRTFDALAQWSSHRVIYDNAGLAPYVFESVRAKAVEIAYPGDHIRRIPGVSTPSRSALTICRIEPENNIDILIEGVLRSSLDRYVIVGNWDHSAYGRALRDRYRQESRMHLMDPIYDSDALAHLRESCTAYIHGHSVGGTNPSLVEMLYYDCALLCFDCVFNRATAKESADYFDGPASLAMLLDKHAWPGRDRSALRARFTRQAISTRYVDAALTA